MQFHPTGTDPTAEAQLACRISRWNLIFLLAIFWAIPAVWWHFKIYWVAYLCIALAAFLTPMMMGCWRRRGRPDNWILAIHGNGVWLNLRDVEYHTAEAGDSIIYVPYSEIISARKYIHRYSTPSSDSETNHKDVYLELMLSSEEGLLVSEALKEEQQRKPPPVVYLRGFMTATTKRDRSPLSVRGDDTLRVKFSMKNYSLTPSIRTTMAELGKYVEVEPVCKEKLDDYEKLTDAEFNNLVSELAAAGRRIDAIGLLRSRKQMSMTEACNFIDELQRQMNEHAPE